MYCELLPTLDQDIVLLTANRRLSHHLHRKYAQYQIEKGKKTWPTPTILPLNAWLSHCWQHCREAQGILLTDFQEQLLWQEIIRLPDKAAQLAKEAWQLMKAWNLSLADLETEANSEARCFIEWALQFETTLKEHQWVSHAELPKRLESLIPHLKLPKQIILVGFDELIPSAHQFFAALSIPVIPRLVNPSSRHGNRDPDSRDGKLNMNLDPAVKPQDDEKKPQNDGVTKISRLSFQDHENEIQTMARWAHTQWQADPTKKIGCLIPDLTQRRAQALRLFTEVFGSNKPFNISAGERFTHLPLIKTALNILELNQPFIDIIQLGSTFHSPYINSNDDDLCLAAMLDVRLREKKHWQAKPEIILNYLDQLQKNFQHSTLKTRCHQWFHTERPTTSLYPSEWAQRFTQELTAIGWPGQRALNTKEYQQCERWKQLLEEFAALDTIIQRRTRKAALRLLRQLAHHTVFQPKSSDEAPIQLLGLLEAAGHDFDKIWITGLNDKNWPNFPKPNPFLPLRLQRRYQMPHSSAKRETDYAIQLQQRLLHSAPTVILSAPLQEGDEELLPSPLIRHFPEINADELHLPPFQSLNEQLFKTKKSEHLFDCRATPLQENEPISGGISVLQSQSDCPFQAFAKIRLQAKPLEESHTGLTGAERGKFVHQVLELIWKRIKDWNTLTRYSDQELENVIDETIDHTFNQEPNQSLFLRVEKKRIKRLIKKWLAFEKKREPFSVSQRETERHIKIGPLNLRVQIDRIDTIGNGHFIIDYKTNNKNKPKDWLGERLKQVQLPLYNAFAARDVNGMAYAQVFSKEMKFNGLIDPKEKPLFSTITASPESWEALTQRWKTLLHQLAVDFSNGKADVDPLDGDTCQYCKLAPLCRVGETV